MHGLQSCVESSLVDTAVVSCQRRRVSYELQEGVVKCGGERRRDVLFGSKTATLPDCAHRLCTDEGMLGMMCLLVNVASSLQR